MAATLISRASAVAQNFKDRAVAVAAIVLAPDGVARGDVTTFPTISSGSGAPTEAAPDGSIYTDVDGTTADNTLYLRIAGAWVANVGT